MEAHRVLHQRCDTSGRSGQLSKAATRSFIWPLLAWPSIRFGRSMTRPVRRRGKGRRACVGTRTTVSGRRHAITRTQRRLSRSISSRRWRLGRPSTHSRRSIFVTFLRCNKPGSSCGTAEIGRLAIGGDLLLASWFGPSPEVKEEGLLGWDLKTRGAALALGLPRPGDRPRREPRRSRCEHRSRGRPFRGFLRRFHRLLRGNGGVTLNHASPTVFSLGWMERMAAVALDGRS